MSDSKSLFKVYTEKYRHASKRENIIILDEEDFTGVRCTMRIIDAKR
jgi:hypothetical protein